MHYIDIDLPTEALVTGTAHDLFLQIEGMKGLWLSANSQTLLTAPEGEITGWAASAGELNARCARPNTGHSVLAQGNQGPALTLRQDINCGFAVENALEDASFFSCLVFYESDAGDAKSLISINPQGAETYMFLNESGAQIGLAMQNGNQALTCSKPTSAGMSLLVISASDGLVSLQAEGHPVQSLAMDLTMLEQPADLFIGCRSDRKGIAKTLGSGKIAEVILLPGRDILQAPDKQETRLRELFDRYLFWER